MGVVAFALWALACTRTAWAQSFTYQGELRAGAQGVTTAHDVTFRVWTLATGGVPVGATTTVLNVLPVDGVFTATVAPGANVFTGAERWLEVGVRAVGQPSFTTLQPRQRIAAVPYASRSLNERWTDLGNGSLKNDDAVVQRLLLNRATPVTGSDYFTVRTPTLQQQFGGMYVDTAAGDGFPFYGYATGGTVRAYHYVDGINGVWWLYNNGNRVGVSTAGNVGIGTAPLSTRRVQVAGTVGVDGIVTTTSDVVSFGTLRGAGVEYSVPQQRYLALGAEAFHAADTATPGVFGEGPDFLARLDSSVAYGEIVAALPLPDNAIVNSMICYIDGPTTSNPLRVELQARLHTLLQIEVLAEASTIGQTDESVAGTISPQNSPINNQSRSYCLRVSAIDWTSSHWVRAIVIGYTVGKPD
jgi:hypothetical protein